MSEAMISTFPVRKHTLSEGSMQLSKQRTLMINERRDISMYTHETNWVRLCSMQKLICAWRTCVVLDVVNRKLAVCVKKQKELNMRMHISEIQTALKYNDFASAWRVARLISSAVRGHTPSANPTMQETIDKYSSPAQQGGWGAKVLTEEFVDSELEPSFVHVDVDVEMNAHMLYNGFLRSVHKQM